MADDFLNRIRMSNVFSIPKTYDYLGASGGGDNYGGSSSPQVNPQIIRQVSSPIQQQSGPSNVVYIPPKFEAGTEILRNAFARDSPEYELANKQLDLQRALGLNKLEDADADRAIKQQRANVYQFKAQNPESKIMIGKDGITRAINPLTNKVTELGQTGMSDEEIMQLNQSNALQKISATGNEQRQTENVRQQGRETLEDMKARHAQELKQFESNLGPLTADLPTQQKQDIQNKYNILINKNPELRDFISLDPNTGMPMITPVGTKGIFGNNKGPTQEQFDKINEMLYGTKSSGVVSSEVKKPEPMYKMQRNSVTGETRKLESLDGGKTWQVSK